ncbi:hypothetical protein GCM10027355_35820 [Haloplanus salinarum]
MPLPKNLSEYERQYVVEWAVWLHRRLGHKSRQTLPRRKVLSPLGIEGNGLLCQKWNLDRDSDYRNPSYVS